MLKSCLIEFFMSYKIYLKNSRHFFLIFYNTNSSGYGCPTHPQTRPTQKIWLDLSLLPFLLHDSSNWQRVSFCTKQCWWVGCGSHSLKPEKLKQIDYEALFPARFAKSSELSAISSKISTRSGYFYWI